MFGQEINAETYAICTADLLLKGEGEAADNIVGGPEHSTLANDAFPSREFDFMLSNPPYGKSWKTDLERMGGKKAMRDPRFVIEHAGDPEYSLVTRSSDGQMLFLANKLLEDEAGHAARQPHRRGAQRQLAVHRRRRQGREQHPPLDHRERPAWRRLSPCRSTCSTTPASPPTLWVLTNRKPKHRRGKVQLIDATKWYRPLRKNLGEKNCELGEDDIARICNAFLAIEETEESRIFDNAAFGYWKVTVDRPLRVEAADPNRVYKAAEIKALKETSKRSEDAAPVLRKIHKRGTEADPLRGLFAANVNGRRGCRGVRAGYRPARHRGDPAAGRRRHRGVPSARGPAVRGRRLVPGGQCEGRLRDQLHALLLQAEADADAGGDSGGYSAAGAGDGGAAGRDPRRRRTAGDDCMTEIIFEVTEDDVDGGYSASALGHGIHTQGESVEEIRSNVKEAVDCYFELTAMPRARSVRSGWHFVRDEVRRGMKLPARQLPLRDAAGVACPTSVGTTPCDSEAATCGSRRQVNG